MGTGKDKGLGRKNAGSSMTTEDRIEREVRRRVADVMSAAGVNSGRIAMEVLYWLPEDFCRLYMQVTDKALVIDTGVKSKMGSQAGDEGQIKARVGTGPTRGKTAGGLHTRTSGAHAKGGGGKRYRTVGVVRDEDAFELKLLVDRKLRELAGIIEDSQRGRGRNARGQKIEVVRASEPHPSQPREGKGETGETHEENLVEEISGDRTLRIVSGGRRQCRGCGKMASKDWVICPRPHNQGKD